MTFRSPYPDVDIPDLSVHAYVFGNLTAEERATTAIVDGDSGTALSYGELAEQIDRVAGALAARGLAVGDTAALFLPNCPAFAPALHGVLRAGGTATTVNVISTAADVAKQLAQSRTRFVLTNRALLPVLADAADRVGLDRGRIVVVDGAEGHPSLADLLAENRPAPAVSFDPATHVAVLPYSSGTTGNPKGVMLTHRNLVANIAQSGRLMGTRRSDRLLAVIPFFHIYGLTVLLNTALRQRASLVTMGKFEPASFLRLVGEHRCTYLYVVPPIAVALAKHPLVDEYDLSSVHTVLTGAAPLDEQLGAAVAARLGCRVRQGYGMTELSPVSHVIPLDRDDIPVSSVGVTVPNMECKLVDPATGAEIEPPRSGTSAPGELWCKGPNVMAGYLDDEQATRDCLDEDGFLHTGDLATVDADGVVTVVDRLKELIKYKGYQVPPAELEAVLLGHPEVADCAVVGVRAGADGEEVPKAFVVRRPGSALTAAAVMEYAAERVAPYKKIRQVEFLDAVPKSATGKILRRQLRAC